MEEIPFIASELMALRSDVRLFNAVANADVHRWFGGSRTLQANMEYAVLYRVLMSIRRQVDPGRVRRKETPEQGLLSLHRALCDAGHEMEARRLHDLPDIRHIRHLADKRIAHAKPVDLERPTEWFPDLRPGTFQPVMLSRATQEMSVSYLRLLHPSLAGLDGVVQYQDPFLNSIRTRGLPAIDFEPIDIFIR